MLQQEPEPHVFLLVNRDDEHRVIRVEQLARDLQPSLHEREPLGVPVVVIGLDVVVVVLPVLRTRVVRRVDVDGVDSMTVGVGQQLQGVEVLSVDDRVERLVVAALHPAGLQLSDHDEVVNRHCLGLRLVLVQLLQVSHSADPTRRDLDDTPQSLIRSARTTARRKHTHFVTTAYGPSRKFDSLGLVPLEDQAESTPLGQRGNLRLQVRAQLRVHLAGLAKKVGQP